ncbi:hypothetical protein CSC12_1869 [Klebsiella michiganensis]|nr:hypothetical protein CSC12_1869 [Klebsiella michiganensis]
MSEFDYQTDAAANQAESLSGAAYSRCISVQIRRIPLCPLRNSG